MQIDLGPLVPHYWTEILAAVVFMILLWAVMAKKVVPAFEKLYEERRDQIEGGMERAEEAQKKAEAALAQYQEQLADAREEAGRIREDAKNQGAQIITEMREQASAEAARIREASQAQLAAERKQVMDQLRGDVGGLATTLAGRIVGESLDDDDRARRTVDRFIADLEVNGSAPQQPVSGATS